ncbi:BMP family ABC transporter substrate-binding protein [Salisediminibacterium halotolerans]|uniref:BMP family ABC transporter substrate-binding protein n=1 Tax=Salisediminibacterium halotolerans TaxID=517425 RepID=UPI000EAC811C|nr:BMP family ABC transporter substrate-binding protein [Salisediminibacterium halotolerans]RLJ75564.1 nucleoside-binding protein [Actinophytocola xinjiangensis]RPE89417.1 nucleoside-binding protein [Salisediminibacterium halotolerans]TWG36177.1 nucleoside-binding protein [Salisediminibacterium halotolerans]GEL08579.1 hypothetical protein SHA02_19950 [Salisediminibacterium halotolerans]
MEEKKRQPRIILIVSIIVAAGLMATLLQRAYPLLTETVSENAAQEENHPTRVSVLTSDVIADQSWGSLAYKGKLQIEESFNATVTLHTEISGEIDKINKVHEIIDEEEPELVIGHGKEFSDPFGYVAERYQDKHFVTIQGHASGENTAAYTLDEGPAEFLAAYAAVQKSETGRIGFLEPEVEQERERYFAKGIDHYGPEVELFTEFIPGRNNGEAAVSKLDELTAKGVDVIYSKGNAYNQHVIEYAAEHDVYVIGYIEDQAYMAENSVLTSVVKRIPLAYNRIMEDHYSSEGIQSGTHTLTFEDDIYDLAELGPMFSADEREQFQKEYQHMHDGELPVKP